jgi:hypothetical protein
MMKNLLFTAAFLLVIWCADNSVYAQGITKTADAFPEASAGKKRLL